MKLFAALAASVAAIGLLAGCGGGSDSTARDPSTAKLPPAIEKLFDQSKAGGGSAGVGSGGLTLTPAEAEKVLREMRERPGSTANAPIKKLLESLRESH
jgi:hypothetical protein